MPVAAVLGWPLRHTLSPRLHNAAYQAAGLMGWRYEARPTPPAALPDAIGELRAGRLAGANLTTPHKRAAVPLLDRLEDLAAELGAVNTVYRAPVADQAGGQAGDSERGRAGAPAPGEAGDLAGGRAGAPAPGQAGGQAGEPGGWELVGANTDVPGLVWALGTELGLAGAAWDGGGEAVLLGTGGVALAVACAWRLLGARRAAAGLPTAPLTVAGRDLGRAAAVAALAGPGAATVPFERAAGLLPAAAVLIQATTLTAAGEPVPGQDRLSPGCFVIDLNYGPKATVLVDAARAAGAAAAAGGLGMLIAQAAEAVTRHTGAAPDIPAMAAAVGRSWPPPNTAQ